MFCMRERERERRDRLLIRCSVYVAERERGVTGYSYDVLCMWQRERERERGMTGYSYDVLCMWQREREREREIEG